MRFMAICEKIKKGKISSHNPKVVGSNPASATRRRSRWNRDSIGFFFCLKLGSTQILTQTTKRRKGQERLRKHWIANSSLHRRLGVVLRLYRKMRGRKYPAPHYKACQNR